MKPINCEDQKRAWHTATYLPHKNLLIAFGRRSRQVGEERAARLAVSEVRLCVSWLMPGRGAGGECVASVGGGGRVAGQSEVVEEVRALDTEIFLWYPPSISGKPPAPR